ncbi:GNAT family N-acetyltransferase [Flavihumibacter fluvii]|uniref:GNAT family N-acetyltransferase n=1 Tax=Flavihumibacter fluvii TaxID=2838157 RepID=UPI001BDEE747|nr:GNAT family N-acetyltransferase [Flavihumibacter fluvii]ULQ53994.1 GNAT family N-acetyltransferase [Flavihumibacter fluvii]
MEPIISRYTANDKEQIVEVWEESVRSTHQFLKELDIVLYKSILQGFDFSSLAVFCLREKGGRMLGFFGVGGDKLEMLFLRPECMGKGYGRLLLKFAIDQLNVIKVDVNEDNQSAFLFYQHFGFVVAHRKPIDEFGKPYPILEMILKK